MVAISGSPWCILKNTPGTIAKPKSKRCYLHDICIDELKLSKRNVDALGAKNLIPVRNSQMSKLFLKYDFFGILCRLPQVISLRRPQTAVAESAAALPLTSLAIDIFKDFFT